MHKAVILQSSYIPWKGYFHLMHEADSFVFLDDVQFTTRDWRTRNRIKTTTGLEWMSIPAGKDRGRRICDVELEDTDWKRVHRRKIHQYYARSAHFADYEYLLDQLYGNSITNLSEFNQLGIRLIADTLGIKTRILDSRTFGPRRASGQGLVDILKAIGATEYVTGPSARDYINETDFSEAGIGLTFFEYPEYPTYDQRYGDFCHNVTILDLMFHVGADAPAYIWNGAR